MLMVISLRVRSSLSTSANSASRGYNGVYWGVYFEHLLVGRDSKGQEALNCNESNHNPVFLASYGVCGDMITIR